ncbi:MAG: Ig domain protein group 2 domain protein, partial [Myxococcaceae bacterium]|nr:Ig domain protein group 2 domain protein [Myxococcaceae bacterium]
AASGTTNPTVTATYDGVNSAPLPVVINAATLASLSFNPGSPTTMPISTTQPLTVTGNYSNGSNFDVSALVTTSSSAAGVASVNSAAAPLTLSAVTASGATPVTLTFTKGTTSGTMQVIVSGACLSGLAISPVSVSTLPVGLVQDFQANATPTTGAATNVSGQGTWSASNTNVENQGAVAGPMNRYKALAKTTTAPTTVTFTLTGANVCEGGNLSDQTIVATANVSVTDATVASISIVPGPVGSATARRIPVGEAQQFTALATLTDGTTGVDVTAASTWNSQAASIASVSTTGLATAASAGSTIISAVYGGQTGNLTINAEACGNPTVSISTAGSGSLPVGQDRPYTALAVYGTSASCTGDVTERTRTVTSAATWISSTAQATISSPGVATGASAGSSNISVTYKAQASNLLPLTVVAVTLQTLTISAPATTFIGADGWIEVTLSATYTDGTTSYSLAPPSVSWNVINPAVASIQLNASKYRLTGLSAGSTQYTASSGTVASNVLSAQITTACITAVTISQADASLPRGAPLALTVSCVTSNGTALPCNPTFTAQNAAVIDDVLGTFATTGAARIASTATVGATSTVTATIPASAGACAGTAKTHSRTLTVDGATLASISLSPTSGTIARGTKQLFAATANWTGGLSLPITAMTTYSSTNLSIASPDNDGTGNVSSLMVDGTTLVQGSYLGVVSPSAALAVNGSTLASLKVSSSQNLVGGPATAATYPAGFALQLAALGTYSDNGTNDRTSAATWTLEAPVLSGASIVSGGIFSTASSTPSGVQTVKAAEGSVSTTFVVNVVNGTVASISIVNPDGTAATASVAKGLDVNYAAQVTLSGSANTYWITEQLNWYSSDITKGTIVSSGANGGKFHSVAAGATNLTAIYGSITGGPLAVTVTNAVPTRISCRPGSVTGLTVGSKVQLHAFVENSDLSENEVTASASWISATALVAEFQPEDSAGVISSRASGVSVISVSGTFSGVALSASTADKCTITVP